MKKLGKFKISGCPYGREESFGLDEIVILASPAVLRYIGEFLTSSAYEMEKDDVEHIHMQDSIKNFSHRNHVDIIVVNQKIVERANGSEE
jgi:hypothetical protein